jgi:uncharacterized protein
VANPVTWFEIIGKDSERLQTFYRGVFGWKMTPPRKEMGNYSMLQDHKPGIGGGIGEGDTRISVYVEVGDPQAYVDKSVAAGARLLMPVTEITPGTTIAMLADPAGNTFGIMKATAPQRRRTARRPAARAKSSATRKRTAKPRTAKPRTRTTRRRR